MRTKRLFGVGLLLLLVVASGLLGLSSVRAQPKPAITLSPTSGPGGTAVTVTGITFTAGDTVSIEIVGNLENRPLTTATVGQDGRFVATAMLPVGGLYPDRITLIAFPLSLPDRSAGSLAQAPTAIFTVTQGPAAAVQLPGTGTGRSASLHHTGTGLVLLATVFALIGALTWRVADTRV